MLVPPIRNSSRDTLIFGSAVFLITFAFFSPALDYRFLNWDDDSLVKNNPYIKNLSLEGIATLFSSFCAGNYTPFERISYGLDYQIFGMDPWGFHFTNILLHSVNAVWLFLLSLKFLALIFSPEKQHDFLRKIFAAATALIFSLHPQRLESVVWIAERRDVLSLFFLLPCVGCYLEWMQCPEKTRRREWFGIATFLLFLSSLLSKATGVTLPVVLLLIDFFPLKRFDCSSRSIPTIFRCILEKAPFFALSLAIGLLSIGGQHMRGAMPDGLSYPWLARLANSFLAIFFYIEKWLLPYSLSPVYETASRSISLLDHKVVACAIWVGLVTLAAFCSTRKHPAFFTTWFSFLMIILPFTGILQAGNQSTADRYSYISTIPFSLFFCAGLYGMLVTGIKLWRKIAVGVMGLWLGALIFLTMNQLPVWKNSISLWEKVLIEAPHEQIPLNNYSTALIAEKKYHLAAVAARDATQKGKYWDYAWHNYGVALSLSGHRDQAIPAFQQALHLNPAFGEAHFALANILFLKKNYVEARSHYFQAIQSKCDPEYLVNLGIALNQTKAPTMAIKYLSWAAFQNDPTAFVLWAKILAMESEFEKARNLLTMAYRRVPEYAIIETHQQLIEGDPQLSPEAKKRLLQALPKIEKR